jgi:hypothetical protein
LSWCIIYQTKQFYDGIYPFGTSQCSKIVMWYLLLCCLLLSFDYRIYVPLVINTSRPFPHSWLINRLVTRLTRWVPLVEQELSTLPEHRSSTPVFSGVRVTRSLVLCWHLPFWNLTVLKNCHVIFVTLLFIIIFWL